MKIKNIIEKEFFYAPSWRLVDIVRGHYFLLTHLIMAVLSLAMFIFWHYSDITYSLAILLIWLSVPSALVIPVAVLFFTQSLMIAVNVMLALHFSLYLVAISVTGYFESPMVLLFTYIPLFALLTGKLRVAFLWTLLCLLGIVFAYIATKSDLPLIPGNQPIMGTEAWYHYNLVFAMAISAVLGFAYERTIKAMSDVFAQDKKAFERETLTDSLTKLANGYQLKKVMQDLQSKGKPFYILLIDSLNFDAVVENYGHHTADKILTLLGEKLSHSVSQYDVVARKQKDQFAIILRKLDNEKDVLTLESLLHEKLSQPLMTEKHQVYLKCRIKHYYIEENDNPDQIEQWFMKPRSKSL